jgi:hypothetical protein
MEWDGFKDENLDTTSTSYVPGRQPRPGEPVGDWFAQRAKFIPLRLTLPERKCLRLLEAALQVSEYTDKIDTIQYGSKMKRIVQQIRELCAILSGLVLAADYKQVRVYHISQCFSNRRLTLIPLFTYRVRSYSLTGTLRPTQISIKQSLSSDGGTRL